MSGFNFGQISNILSNFMDSDFIDIKRDSGGKLEEVYSNVPCHLAFNSTDNPDPNSVDIKPIIQSITIHCGNWVDLRNNDFIVAKRMDNAGNLLKVYSGRCGNPVVSQGRQKVLITMSATEPEPSTPTPPINPAIIRISYLYNETSIQDSSEQKIEIGSSFSLSAPLIEGYSAVDCSINGIVQGSSTAIISTVKENEYNIIFIYDVDTKPNMYRFLVKGIYTKDDGSLANGYHLYRKVDIDSISEAEGVFTITSDNVKQVHDDNGKTFTISVGAKIVLIPRNIFVEVTKILGIENNKVTFIAKEFVPTEDEKKAYVTGWYD